MSIADLFCDRIESAQRASRWGIGRASIYLRGLGVDGVLLKEADAKLVYTDEESVVEPPQVAYELTGDELDMGDGRTAKLVRPVALRAKAMEAGSIFEFTATLTSNQIDRDGDRLEPTGAQVDMLGPLLWNHLSTEPIGKPVKIVAQNSKRLVMRFAIADTPLGRDIAQLVEFGALRRMSHGFIPEDYEEMTKDGQFCGWHVKKFEVLEFSIVSVASNRDAVIAAMSRDKLCHPLVKGWAGRLFEERSVIVRGAMIGKPKENGEVIPFAKSTSSTFDVWREHLESASLEYDWVSRYIGCQVKHLFWVTTSVPKARIGSWLTGLREIVGEYKVEDTRHISAGGDELPPKYEIIQLTPERSDDFLVQGLQFRCGREHKFAVGFEPYWGMLEVTFYTSNDEKDKQFARDVIDKTWEWSRRNNFLKGQAFSLTGGFLPKSGEQWDKLFLPSRNKAPVTRAVRSLNEKQAAAPNRGMILMGPPGTGKTLSARIVRNEAKASFIWVSARDFWNCGSYGAFTNSFDLARELAPCVVCFEDVDNWMDRSTEDLLKTEMDGMGRSSGIVTLLTTNYPERIPDSLIDRPGRFHDVLLFDLPDAKTRSDMLAAWLPESGEKDRRKAVDKTEGYSGAHIYELVQYAKGLQEEEELSLGEALVKAVDKIEEQREMITGVQLEGSRYKPNRSTVFPIKAFVFGNKHEKAILDDSASGGQEAVPPVPDTDLNFPADEKPYPSEFSCRLRDPADFQANSFRRSTREHDGKEYSVIMGKLKGADAMTDQAYRYKKDKWDSSEAKAHCKDRDGTFEAASEASVEPQTKGMVPSDPPGGGGEGEEGEWSKPSLSDFTDKMWEDCSMMEKNAIAKHFAWYSDMDTFGALKLPHHFPDSGKPSLNGVRNALARAGQVDGISGDLEKVRAHLQAHMPEKAAETAATSHSIKSGRTLSKANESSIRDAKDDCDEIAGMDGLSRAAKALATRASKSLESVLESSAAIEEQTEDKRAKKPDIAVMVAKAVSGAIRRAKG